MELFCQNCGRKLVIPADKHIAFECPYCHSCYEYDNGHLVKYSCCSKSKETPSSKDVDTDGKKEESEEKDSLLADIFDWFCSLIIAYPIFAWLMNIIPDMN